MPNRAYRNGANFERRVKAKLEGEGWTVFRTAGSHSLADLIAFWPVDEPVNEERDTFGHTTEARLFIQCKGGAKGMGPKARQEFFEFADRHGATAVVAGRGMKLTRLEEVLPESSSSGASVEDVA